MAQGRAWVALRTPPENKWVYYTLEPHTIYVPRYNSFYSKIYFGHLHPPWKTSWNLNSTHARNFQGCSFHEGKSPCGMQLAQPGLVSTRNFQKSFKHDGRHAEHFQERSLYKRQSPCGMQRARQELVKLNSGKIQSKMSISHANPNKKYMN